MEYIDENKNPRLGGNISDGGQTNTVRYIGVNDMKKLCELKEDEKVIVKYKEGMTEVIDAGEIESCIAYNEGFSLEFYTAVKDTVQINERELITKLTEMLGNDQYEDWEDDMYYELIDEKETKAFVEAFNRAAENRASYRMGEAIDLAN